MRSLVALALAMTATFGIAQKALPELGKPLPVDFHVTRVDWHPTGDRLMYVRKVGQGQAIGTYEIGQDQGKPLVHVQKGDTYNIEWLPGTRHGLAVTNHDDKATKTRRIQVHLMNAETQQSHVLFNREFLLDEAPRLTMDVSPMLLHAIFRLYTVVDKKQHVQHFVLKTGQLELTQCDDLDRAAKEGLSGPSWSIDGTAVFAQGGPANPGVPILAEVPLIGQLFTTASTNAAEKAAVSQGTFAITLNRVDAAALKESVFSIGAKWVASPPAPPVGAPVLELMPQNGTLRQVRFRGGWNYAEPPVKPLAPIDQAINLTLGRSKGQSKAIWLTEGNQAPEGGVLVSPNASNAWIGPRNRAIGFLTEGALFIREMK